MSLTRTGLGHVKDLNATGSSGERADAGPAIGGSVTV
jgi:hypothetical protein